LSTRSSRYLITCFAKLNVCSQKNTISENSANFFNDYTIYGLKYKYFFLFKPKFSSNIFWKSTFLEDIYIKQLRFIINVNVSADFWFDGRIVPFVTLC